MRVEWGEEGSEQRRYVSGQFLQQLRDDPAYAGEKTSEVSHIWRDYQRDMNDEGHLWQKRHCTRDDELYTSKSL
jgi:hypothetical protein